MRIVGGEFRGVRIDVPKNFRARPTTDMAKESLFNILANQVYFSELEVLDLFSGTGGISFEFASRGCREVTLVEKNFVHFKHIVKSIEKLKLKEAITPIKSEVFNYIKACRKKFDLIFADPPYDIENLNEIPVKILDSGILKDGGIFILEHSGNYSFGDMPFFASVRKYGSVHFSFFKK